MKLMKTTQVFANKMIKGIIKYFQKLPARVI